MKVGLVGKPNVGKSTFYAASSLADAEIGDYPFTTIDANRGVGYVRVADPGPELGVASTPRSGKVVGATRYVPVELVDVAGLVPGAHEGRGLGNRFLSNLAEADALVHVVDASGRTDEEGNPLQASSHDPIGDIAFLEAEIDHWIDGILADGWEKLTRRVQQEGRKMEIALEERLAGIGITAPMAHAALRHTNLIGVLPTLITVESRRELAKAVRRVSKPIVVALNKADLATEEQLKRIEAHLAERSIPSVRVSAQSELALQKGAQAGAFEYVPGSDGFVTKIDLNPAQKKGMEYIQSHVLDRFGTTGVHAALEAAVLGHLGLIPVYPVEDDHHFTDKDGRVLPDCHLVRKGTTAKQLAYRVHTDLGDHFIRGVDCRTRRTIGADYELKAGDVVRIAANA